MRRASALVIAAAAFAVGAAGATTAPALRLAGMRPLAVVGVGFAANESVRIVATVRDERHVKRTVATPAGRFAVAFRNVFVDRCTTFRVAARGTKGSRAVLVPKSLAECPEPVGP